MGRASQIKSTGDGAVVDSTRKHFAKEERLNLNDLLARKQKEKRKREEKPNQKFNFKIKRS